MKKLFMTLAIAATAFMATTANAETYTDNLAIKLNGEIQDPQEATIDITDNGDGTAKFLLNDFTFGVFVVGDVVVESIPATADGDATVYDYEGDAQLPSEDALVAVALGHKVPVKLHAVVKDGKLYAEISLNVVMGENEIAVDVTFGTEIETAINGVNANGKTAPVAVFNAAGARQNGLKSGLNIVRNADGKTVKVMK